MKYFSKFLKWSVAAVLFATLAPNASAWGQKGHDVVCALAERHLTPKAKKQIDKILDGKSIVYWACWLDNASYTPEYKYTKTWHYKNVDADETYENAALCPTGDAVTAIYAQIDALKSGTLNKEATALALKMLVHIVGDLHNPMHMGHLSDLGGNKWQVQFFDNGRNLHSVWDSGIVDSGHHWTYTEWCDQIDRIDRKTAESISSGTPDDWAKECVALAAEIYDKTPVGTKISYDYIAQWTPSVEQQFLKGGYRLAKILNDIFK